MEKDIVRVTRARQNVEVTFVSDDDVNKIVKPLNFTTKSPGKVKNQTPVKRTRAPQVFTSVTRSGRKINSRIVNILNPEAHQSDEDEELSASTVKSTVLFEDGDIAGSQIFGFHTPKRRTALANKASECTPKEAITSPKECALELSNAKTPFSFRTQLKKNIAKEVSRLEDDVISDDSGSEFNPSDASESDDESSGSDSDIRPLDQVKTPVKKLGTTPLPMTRSNRVKENKYIFTSEEYFESKATKALTSDHTLSKLKTPKLGQDQLAALLKSVNPSHHQFVKKLNKEHEQQFNRWLFTLREGFNILCFGLGSKRNLLNSFHREYLSECPVLVVNGFFPGLTVKEILDGIADDLLGIKNIPTQPHDILSMITHQMKNSSRIFLIIHNIDGPMLRSDKVQNVLCQLAKIPNIHLIASVDHINCPLLWDQNKLSCYNFAWEDCTSFLPYSEETRFESSMLIQRSGSLALVALKNVFKSLTTNSRKIFKLILKFQLENTNKNIGMQFSELYRSCRDAFIVSSDLALRTQLTEFIDHQLLKWKKETEHLIIPIETSILKQFQTEINDEE